LWGAGFSCRRKNEIKVRQLRDKKETCGNRRRNKGAYRVENSQDETGGALILTLRMTDGAP